MQEAACTEYILLELTYSILLHETVVYIRINKDINSVP